jgi:hypothetical protein
MSNQKPVCCICSRPFVPHPKVGERQKICNRPECRKAHKKKNNAEWRRKNPEYFKNDYHRIKVWRDQHPDYLRQYRQDHPEYVLKNREGQRRRDRYRKLNLDIQAKINLQVSEIAHQLSTSPIFPHLDIQAGLIMKPFEMALFMATMIRRYSLDIQAGLDFTAPFQDNRAIKQGGNAYGY